MHTATRRNEQVVEPLEQMSAYWLEGGEDHRHHTTNEDGAGQKVPIREPEFLRMTLLPAQHTWQNATGVVRGTSGRRCSHARDLKALTNTQTFCGS